MLINHLDFLVGEVFCQFKKYTFSGSLPVRQRSSWSQSLAPAAASGAQGWGRSRNVSGCADKWNSTTKQNMGTELIRITTYTSGGSNRWPGNWFHLEVYTVNQCAQFVWICWRTQWLHKGVFAPFSCRLLIAALGSGDNVLFIGKISFQKITKARPKLWCIHQQNLSKLWWVRSSSRE